MVKKISSCVLSIFILITLVCQPAFAVTKSDDQVNKKIDSLLLEKIQNIENQDEEVTVSVWFSDISEEKLNDEMVSSIDELVDKGELSLNSVMSTRATEDKKKIKKETQLLLNTRRSVSKKLYKQKNANELGIVSRNLGLNQEDILYSCSYAPNATLTVKALEVYELASNSNVETFIWNRLA